VRSPPSEEEGAAETSDELTTMPLPRPPVLLRGRRERKLGVWLSLGQREGWGKGVFLSSGFTSHYSAVI